MNCCTKGNGYEGSSHYSRRATLFLVVGLSLLLNIRANGQQTNAIIAEERSLTVTNQETPRRDFAEIRTLSGATYKSVRVLKAEPDCLLLEHSPQGGGIGLVKVKFENLSAELRQEYGYDVQKAAAYRTQQAAMERQLAQQMQAQQAREAQERAAMRARAEDNFKGRLEIDRLENERRKAEAERVRDEAYWARMAKEDAQRDAAAEQAAIRANQMNQESVEQGYQIRNMWNSRSW